MLEQFLEQIEVLMKVVVAISKSYSVSEEPKDLLEVIWLYG